MFSFCKLLYLNMFRRGAREAVRVFLVFPQIAQICTDAVRALLVFPQIAQICTDAVRGGLIPQIAPRRGRCHRCRSGAACFPTDRADLQMPFGVFLVFPQIAQICTDAVRGASCFPHRLRRWRQGASVSFVTMLHVTCYNKVVPYCAGWALRNYIVYILYI